MGYSRRALQRRPWPLALRPRLRPLRDDALSTLRAQRPEATRDLAGALAELRRRPSAGEQPVDAAASVRPRHHALRPGQQLRATLRERRDQFRADLRRGLPTVSRGARDLDEGGLGHVAGTLRRVRIAQV